MLINVPFCSYLRCFFAEFILIQIGQHDDPSTGVEFQDRFGCRNTVHAAHGDIHSHQFRIQPLVQDDSIIAEDSVEVSLGRTEAVESFIQIDEPAQGEVLDIAKASGAENLAMLNEIGS